MESPFIVKKQKKTLGAAIRRRDGDGPDSPIFFGSRPGDAIHLHFFISLGRFVVFYRATRRLFFICTWVIIIKLYAISFFLSFYVCVFHLGWKTEKGLQASEKDGRATD
jgi:hypothetical protein